MSHRWLPVFLPLILAGCSAPSAETSTLSTDFTGVGKPTKSVTTEFGTYDVYDATQDPEVIAYFNTIYAAPKSERTANRDTFLRGLSSPRQTQIYDCLRAGGHPTYPYSQNTRYESTIPANCPDPRWGSPTLTECEQKYSTQISNTEVIGPAVDVVTLYDIGAEGMFGGDKRQQLAGLIGITCSDRGG